MWKNDPSKVNENGMVGKPAGPTLAPGGRVAVALCVAGAEVLAVALEAPGAVGATAVEPAAPLWLSFTARKSTWAARAAAST